ncbi:MAG TPA: class I SAM-dependent methyltransferase [Chloroflexota bacterium]|nr:class I SAM-dependent methyltransferase [Chloroflexota bacterium]
MGDKSRGSETWQWDETLFAGTAAYYVRGRLPYAPNLADVLAETLGLDGQGRLLDIGCGPGTIALLCARLFESVVGLDPDPDMLAEAARLARERDVTNASWVCRRAEEIRPELGQFRAVTFAASFHWMDRPRVAATVRSMLDPNGAAVQIDAPAYRPDEAVTPTDVRHPPPPQDVIVNLRQRYLGPDRRAGQGIRNTSPDNEDGVFRSVGYRPAERVTVPDGRVLTRTIDDLVAGVFSTSSTAPHLFGSRLQAFEADLRAELAAASPTGLFSVRLPDNIVSIWHPRK